MPVLSETEMRARVARRSSVMAVSFILPCEAQAKRGRGTTRSVVEGALGASALSSTPEIPCRKRPFHHLAPQDGPPFPAIAGQDDSYNGSFGSSARTRWRVAAARPVAL